MTFKFDSIDKAILDQLQTNSRISMKKIGEAVHLSAPAVAERVKRLESIGIITSYGAHISPKAMGYKIEADILVLLSDMKCKRKFISHLQTEPEVIAAFEVMGRADAMLRVVSMDMDRLLALVRRLQAYGHTETYLHMSIYKKMSLPDFIVEE